MIQSILRYMLFVSLWMLLANVAACAYDASVFDVETRSTQNCKADEQSCDGKCVARLDKDHCGTCDRQCTHRCDENQGHYECSCGGACTGNETCVDNPAVQGDKICQCLDAEGKLVDEFGTDQNCSECGDKCIEGTSCKGDEGHKRCFCDNGKSKCDPNAVVCDIDLKTDRNHCGICFHQCDDGSECTDGYCCYNLTNEDHAQKTGYDEAMSACQYICDKGYANCNDDWQDGCEIYIAGNDIAHCGSCNACPSRDNATSYCQKGQCKYICNKGYDDCNGDDTGSDSDGCEANLIETHRTTCRDCQKDWDSCNEDWSDGCETQITDTNNCGACRNECLSYAHASASCSQGECTPSCESGWGNCNGKDSDGCEAQLNTINNCGSCGNECFSYAHASAFCIQGECTPSCESGWGNCNSGSFDDGWYDGCETNIWGNDKYNCGGCNNICYDGWGTCWKGECYDE